MTATAPAATPATKQPSPTPLHLTQILVSYEDAVRLLRIRDTYDWHQHVWKGFAGIIPQRPNKGRFAKGTRPEDQEKTPPVSSATRRNPTVTVRIDHGAECCTLGTVRIISGLALRTKVITEAVTTPSTMPMARCIGSMSAVNGARGSAEIPDATVSTTTAKAPIWSPMMAAVIAATEILAGEGAFPEIVR